MRRCSTAVLSEASIKKGVKRDRCLVKHISPRSPLRKETLMKKGLVQTSNDGAPAVTVHPVAAPVFVLPQLPLLRLELTFAVDEPVELPPFRGNLWRGILGPALMRIDEGLLPGVSTGEIARGTLYRAFFESPPPPDATKMRLYTRAPHPYVVDAPGRPGFERLEAGATERIGLTLAGRAASAVEAVLASFDFAARVGIGRALGRERERGRARLVEARAVWRGEAPDLVAFEETRGFRAVAPEVPAIPPCPARLRVTLATSLRLQHQGRVLDARNFTPAPLLSNLVRRVSMLSTFYASDLETDFRALKALWEGLVARERMLAAADLKRWSGHSKQEIDMDGIIGSFVLDMRGREPLFPYLWLGQWLHAGKGAVMGLGAIRLRPD
jgi:hypothetical protein